LTVVFKHTFEECVVSGLIPRHPVPHGCGA